MLNESYPHLIRRILAIAYDSLLLISLWFAGTAIALFFTNGQAIAANNILFKIYLLAISITFVVWFWTHGGQTTGMAAWKIKLVTRDNQPLTNTQALYRAILAIPLTLCGIGMLWALFDRKRQTLYDHLTKTKMIYHLQPKRKITSLAN